MRLHYLTGNVLAKTWEALPWIHSWTGLTSSVLHAELDAPLATSYVPRPASQQMAWPQASAAAGGGGGGGGGMNGAGGSAESMLAPRGSHAPGAGSSAFAGSLSDAAGGTPAASGGRLAAGESVPPYHLGLP